MQGLHPCCPSKAGTPRHALSTLEIVAPEGRHGWLNDHGHVSTLDSLRPPTRRGGDPGVPPGL